MILKLWQGNVSDLTNIRLLVYGDNGSNLPDFNNLIGQTVISGLIRINQEDITFNFNNPISLIKDQKYWFVLDVESYSDSRGYYRNNWKNAVHTAFDAYSGGVAGRGTAGICDSWCSFGIPFPNSKSDWYMKIGLE